MAPPPPQQQRPAPPPPAAAAVDDAAAERAALPYPDAPPEIDEEEEEERRFVPPFALLEDRVADEDAPAGQAEPVLEVLRFRGDRLLEAQRLTQGGTCNVPTDQGRSHRLIQVLKKGRARLFFRVGDEGTLILGGQRIALASLCDDAHLVSRKHGRYAVELEPSDRAELLIDGAGYFIRSVLAPMPPERRLSLRPAREDKLYASFGILGVILLLVGVWIHSLFAPPELLVMEETAQFAEISLKDLEMAKPPEPPKPPEPVAVVQAPPDSEPAPAAAPKPPEPAPQQAKRQAPQRASGKRSAGAQRAAQPAAAPANDAAADALAALDGIAPVNSGEKLSAAVSNIAAVRVPTGAPSSFQVSGAIGKVPDGEVTLSRGGKAGGGGGGRDTRGAAALLAGKDVGKVGGGGGTGKVRGVVERQPARSVGTQGGSLDRAAILKVVNGGIAAVQACYERQLMQQPGLQGKILFDWVIAADGSVASTRVRSSSLASQPVATCISGVIKRWQFPKPTGGSVTVTFPFVFNVQGF